MNTSETISEFRRKESRYRVSDPTEVRVVVRTDDASNAFDAQLIDLSNNGIQLRVFACLKFEQSIEVHVSARDIQFDLVASVKWLREADALSWFVGCRIEPELSEQTVTQLASMALLERRGGRRREVCLDASVCGQLERTFTPAVVRNLSEDGFGITTLESQPVAQRIRVQLRQHDGEAIDVSARVVWQLKTPDGFSCGCSFLNRECFNRLTELADAQPVSSSSTASLRREKTLRTSYWVALAAFVVFVFPSVFVMLVDKDPSPAPPVAQMQLLHADMGDQVRGADSAVRPARPTPDATEVDRLGVGPPTHEPRAKVAPRNRSTSSVTALVTREQRIATAAPAKIWMDQVVNLTREFMETLRQFSLTVALKTATNPLAQHPTSIADDADTSGNARSDGAPHPVSPEPEPTPDEFMKAAVEKENKHAERLEKPLSQFRVWMDDTGRYRVVARIVAVRDGTVRLLKENGRFVSVPLVRLSGDDERYIQRWLQAPD